MKYYSINRIATHGVLELKGRLDPENDALVWSRDGGRFFYSTRHRLGTDIFKDRKEAVLAGAHKLRRMAASASRRAERLNKMADELEGESN